MLLLRGILLASAPALFWLWLFYRRDRWEKEPKSLVLRLYLFGALAAVPAYFAEYALLGRRGLWFDLFVAVGVVEELAKILPVLLFACRHRAFNEPMDGILYAVAAALGFATVENGLYAVYLGPLIIVPRSLTATLMHVGMSGLVGYQLGRARFLQRGRLWRVLTAFAVVVVLHGSYDLLLLRAAEPGVPALLGQLTVGLMIPTLLVMLWLAVRRADRLSPFRPPAQPR